MVFTVPYVNDMSVNLNLFYMLITHSNNNDVEEIGKILISDFELISD